MKRADWDKRVLRVMFADYCRVHHGVIDSSASDHSTTELCGECSSLLHYAFERIDNCPLGDKKSTCQRCAIHCYSPSRREQIRVVMRFSGKRLMLTHPLMAIRHLVKVIFA